MGGKKNRNKRRVYPEQPVSEPIVSIHTQVAPAVQDIAAEQPEPEKKAEAENMSAEQEAEQEPVAIHEDEGDAENEGGEVVENELLEDMQDNGDAEVKDEHERLVENLLHDANDHASEEEGNDGGVLFREPIISPPCDVEDEGDLADEGDENEGEEEAEENEELEPEHNAEPVSVVIEQPVSAVPVSEAMAVPVDEPVIEPVIEVVENVPIVEPPVQDVHHDEVKVQAEVEKIEVVSDPLSQQCTLKERLKAKFNNQNENVLGIANKYNLDPDTVVSLVNDVIGDAEIVSDESQFRSCEPTEQSSIFKASQELLITKLTDLVIRQQQVAQAFAPEEQGLDHKHNIELITLQQALQRTIPDAGIIPLAHSPEPAGGPVPQDFGPPVPVPPVPIPAAAPPPVLLSGGFVGGQLSQTMDISKAIPLDQAPQDCEAAQYLLKIRQMFT